MRRAYEKRSSTPTSGSIPSFNETGNLLSGPKTILDESPNLGVLKHQVGYLSYQTKMESTRILQEFGIKTMEKIQSLAGSYISRLASSTKYWENLAKVNYKQEVDRDINLIFWLFQNTLHFNLKNPNFNIKWKQLFF